MEDKEKMHDIIKSKLDIKEVAQSYQPCKKYLYCPMCDSKQLSLNLKKKLFYCFGCHMGGDVIHLVAMAERISFSEAAVLLAERYNINLSGQTEVPNESD